MESLQKGTLVIDKLEGRFGRFAIPNVTLFLIAGQVLAFLAIQRNSDARQTLELIPQEVLNGEVQRIVTFLFLPPSTSLLWAFFSWYLFYLMGTALEHYWGSFRYNVFLLIGYCATVAVSFLTPEGSFENYFVELTVFLAFAYLNPYFELRLFFVLPVQIRWFAILTWTGYAVGFISGGWTIRLGIAAAVLNFFIFLAETCFNACCRGGAKWQNRQNDLAPTEESRTTFMCVMCAALLTRVILTWISATAADAVVIGPTAQIT